MYKAYQWSDFLSFTKKKIIRLLLPYICTIWLVYLVRGAIGYWFFTMLIPNINSRFSINNITGKN